MIIWTLLERRSWEGGDGIEEERNQWWGELGILSGITGPVENILEWGDQKFNTKNVFPFLNCKSYPGFFTSSVESVMHTNAMFETEKINRIKSAEARDDHENLSPFHISRPPSNP